MHPRESSLPESPAAQSQVSAAHCPTITFEYHFTPAELGGRWNFSDTKIRRMFENEPGVMRVGEPSRRLGRKLKRSYYTLRIPESVAERVYRRLVQNKRVH